MHDLSILQPLYGEMIKNTNRETVRRVHEELKRTNPASLQKLQEYTLFPLITAIESDSLKNKEVITELIVTLVDVLESTNIRKLVPLKIIVVVMLKRIFDMGSSTLKPNLSEELKLAVVQCLDVAIRNSSTDVKVEFYVPESRALIGQIVFVCVNFIEKEIFKTLRMLSIKCLLSILYLDKTADFSDMILRNQISNEVYVMTPKILAVLKGVALGEDKLGHSLISLAVKAIGKFLCLIFEDYKKTLTTQELNADVFRQLINKNQNESSASAQFNILSVKVNTNSPKTDEWLHAAIQKIAPTIDALKKLIGNQNSKIRLELAKMTIILLEKCLIFIKPCVNDLVEIVLALSQDEDESISKLCDATFRTTFQEFAFRDVIEQIFITHIIRLPRIIAVGDEDDQMAGMLLLKGLLQSLRHSNLKIILSNKDTLERFTTVLLSAVELKRDMSLLLEEYSLRKMDETDIHVLASPWKQFKNLRNQAIVDLFKSFCELLGTSNASEIVVNYLLELQSSDVSSCNEVVVLLQFILSIDGHRTLICNCLEYFLSENHWHLAIQANTTTKLEMEKFGESQWYEDRTEGLYESAISVRYTDVRWNGSNYENRSNDDEITIADAMFNVLHISLVLETIGRFALVLRTDFHPFLFKSLHRILEKSGSSNYAIHSAGLFALNQLKICFGHENISDLIHENSDYITYFVNIALRKVNQSQIALDILSVVLKYSSLETIPHLENIITTVLCESSKYEQSPNTSSFLKVFKMILCGINEWNVPTEAIVSDTETASEENELEVRDNWLRILKPSEKFEDPIDKTTFDEEKFREEQEQKLKDQAEIDNEVETETKEILPPYIDVTIQILKRCIKYLSSKSQLDKCIVLEAIECGLNILKTTENQLLPIVHLVWKPFVERFKDNDPIVLRRCFQLLIKLGEVSKDFIYQRTTKDVLPFIVTFLKSSAKSSINVTDVTYEHTQQFKLQMELLQNLPELLIAIEIAEKDLSSILDAMTFFCGDDQHKALQESCVKFLVKLAEYDATAVYVKLLAYQGNSCYKKNVNEVLRLL